MAMKGTAFAVVGLVTEHGVLYSRKIPAILIQKPVPDNALPV
jgi:hypothetical protein